MLSGSSAASAAAAKKVLPIYCVDRDDNKIAISFDAAWGGITIIGGSVAALNSTYAVVGGRNPLRETSETLPVL